MRVLVLRNAEARTNASLARIATALTADGHNVSLLTRNRDGIAGEGDGQISYNVEGKSIINHEIRMPQERGRGMKNLLQLLRYQRRIYRQIRVLHEECDVIHSFDLDTGVVSAIAAWRWKIPFVYHIADFYADSRSGLGLFQGILRKLEYQVIQRAEVTILCSEARHRQILGARPKRVAVVPNVPVVENAERKALLKARPRKSEGASLCVTYVGGLTPRRFVDVLLHLAKDRPWLELHLAGTGVLASEAIALAEKHSNIIFHGAISYDEALILYSKTDVMVAMYDARYANYRYSAPNKVYEAMMLGKPLLVAEGTGLEDLVEGNEIGWVLPYEDDAFLAALERLRQEPETRKKLEDNALSAYAPYAWPMVQHMIQNIYRRLI